ncbi:putative signal transduction protein with Nacht domain [Kalymmatonema gypsitolerans NIES-4073]|nr:putative signal transduction protein with Nacht domain [Scytonema sp. NIES-4073]
MNQKRRRRTVRLSKGGIEQLEQAKDKGRDDEGKPLTFESIAQKAKVSDKTVKRFFRGEAVDPGYADAIIEALDLKKEEVLSSEESLVVESIERIEARSAELERHGTHSDRAGELIEELERKLKELKKSTDDSHQAMDWLKANRKALAQEAALAGLREHYNQLSSERDMDYLENVEQFSKDIRKYLQLLYYCLEEGTWNLIDQAIHKTLIPLNLESKFYVKALIFIKEQRVAKDLPPEAAKELILCLDYLINIIPIRF